jgi:hypothetical protein
VLALGGGKRQSGVVSKPDWVNGDALVVYVERTRLIAGGGVRAEAMCGYVQGLEFGLDGLSEAFAS